jgi:protein TonB
LATAVVVAETAPPARAEQPAPRPPPPPDLEREHEEAAPSAPAPAPQPASAGPPPEITEPVWLQRPRDTARFYPRAAFVQGVEGRVVLDCFVEVNGRLECSVTSETPPGQGFADAALAIAAAHVMQPATQNGAPVRARYRMIVPFSSSQ